MIGVELAAGCECRVEVVDISESDVLFERYGTRIPVLRHPDGREMDWPFEQLALARFLRA
ncbi:MAG: thioredoxin family protein [Halioglobus sp.]|nr:thioredoxin family protein [Halioglobus sp.]